MISMIDTSCLHSVFPHTACLLVPSARHPRYVRIFANPPGGGSFGFSDLEEQEPTQEFELAEDRAGELEYFVKANRFTSLQHLALHFPSTLDEERFIFERRRDAAASGTGVGDGRATTMSPGTAPAGPEADGQRGGQ